MVATNNKRQPLIDPIKDLKINDIDFVDGTKRVTALVEKMACFQCLQCKKINEHVRKSKTVVVIVDVVVFIVNVVVVVVFVFKQPHFEI